MDKVFDSLFSRYYDLIYENKDYKGECGLIEKYAMASNAAFLDILDLGCGTGKHSRLLAERGHKVLGIDQSAEMIDQARLIPADGLSFETGDIKDFDLGKQFDLALLMFAVLGYVTETADLKSAFSSIRKCLRPSGKLFFDVWHGPAVLAQRPERRKREFETSEGKLTRFADGVLDEARNVCEVTMRLRLERDDGEIEEETEIHPTRYFWPEELTEHLEQAGFMDVTHRSFPSGGELTDRDWNFFCVATVPE